MGTKRDDDFPMQGYTRVESPSGRWVVWLNVQSWSSGAADQDHPINNQWKQINDYATRREAEVAARWIERSVNR